MVKKCFRIKCFCYTYAIPIFVSILYQIINITLLMLSKGYHHRQLQLYPILPILVLGHFIIFFFELYLAAMSCY